MKIGAKAPPVGLGVNAVAAICSGLLGFTARFGSLSWFVSPLMDFGIILTTVIFVAAPFFAFVGMLPAVVFPLDENKSATAGPDPRCYWPLLSSARTRSSSATG